MQQLFVGVDLGGTNVRVSLIDHNATIVNSARAQSGRNSDPFDIVSKISEMIQELMNTLGGNDQLPSISGVGVGVPGTVNCNTGVIHYAPNLQWRNVNFGDELQKKTGLPVVVDNDVNMAAVGECTSGAGKESENCLIMTIGTGIGGAYVSQGKLFRGCNNNACEIGHMRIVDAGPVCACGRKGCFETLASATALVRMANEAGIDSVESARDLIELAKSDNSSALMIFEKYLRYLSSGIASLLHIFNPDTLIIGGGVSLAGDFLFDRLRKYVKEESMSLSFDCVQILPASLGDDSGVIGAAATLRMVEI